MAVTESSPWASRMLSVFRIVAGALFILAAEMAVAYFQFHHPQAFFPTTNNGVPAVLYCFFFLYLAFAGAGTWSIDALIARRRV